jgi:hypothetical protein
MQVFSPALPLARLVTEGPLCGPLGRAGAAVCDDVVCASLLLCPVHAVPITASSPLCSAGCPGFRPV